MNGPANGACPDWRRLAGHRRELGGAEPEGWGAALAHLAGCRLCRGEALAVDPTLIFRRLPELSLEGDALAAEVAALQQGVATLRAASRLQQEPRRFARASGWKSWAAAAAVAAGAGAGLWTSWHASPAAQVAAPIPIAVPAAMPTTPMLPAAQRVENIDRPNARVKQYGGKSREDPSVVMIYDQSLNV
jgi:hypothetical protein